MDTYGYLYSQNFYPNSPSLNLIQSDDDSGGNNQFQFEVYLQSNMTYVLVSTTFGSMIVGDYEVIVQGLYTVNMRKSNNICGITTATGSTRTTTTGFIDNISIFSK